MAKFYTFRPARSLRLVSLAVVCAVAALCAKAGDYSDSKFDYKYNKTTKVARVVGAKNRSATSLEIPSKITVNSVSYTVTMIGAAAFEGMESLKTITLPSTIESIGIQAFCNCFKLQSITIPSKVTEIPNDCFSMCLALKEVNLSKNLTRINEAAFTYCQALETINWPSKLQYVGKYAFFAAKLPMMVELPASCVAVDEEAFRCTEVEWFKLPASMQTIGKRAFSDNSLCRTITMPTSVGAIGDRAFFGNEKLDNVVLPATIGSMGEGVLESCDGLTSITLSGQLHTIPTRTCYQCEFLTSVTIPSGVTAIGEEAFGDCYRLASVSIPATCTSIANSAFEFSGIKFLTIPEGVKTIGQQAFNGCHDMMSVRLPKSLTSIGVRAFDNCSALRVVNSYMTTPCPLGVNGFHTGTYTEGSLIVPAGCVDQYYAAAEWEKFANIKDVNGQGDAPAVGEDAAAHFAVDASVAGQVTFNGCTSNLTIYNLSGQCVADADAPLYAGEPVTVTLPAGVYLARCGGASRKVVVR